MLQLIGISLFIWIISSIDTTNLYQSIKNIDAILILWVLTLQVLIIFIKSIRWHILCTTQTNLVHFHDSWKMYNIGFFISLATPAKLGEFSKVMYLKNKGVPTANASALVVVDRLADVLLILIIGLASVWRLFGWHYALMGIVCGAICVGCYLLFKSRIAKYIQFLTNLDLHKILKAKVLLPSIFLTIIGWGTYFIWAISIAYALNMYISIPILVSIFTITGLIALMPIAPSGLGTRDATLIVLLAPYGIESAQAVSLALIMFASPIIISSIGALYFISEKLHKKSPFKHGKWTLEDVANHWDNSPEYDNQNAKLDSYFRRFVDSAPLFEIPNHAKVLDIDCRTGNGTCFFQEKYPSATFTCVASSQLFKDRAEARLQEHGVSADVHIFKQLKQPFDNEHFDVVLTYETLEHVPWPDLYIEELSRIIKPGGTMVLTTPNVLWEPVHWLSATLHIDHGEGPHRMVPRHEILAGLEKAGFAVTTERTFVIVPAGPKWLLNFGRWLERILPEWILRTICLRRTFICRKKDEWWTKLKEEIVDTGLETQCGTAIGVSNGTLEYKEVHGVPTLSRTSKAEAVPRIAYEACPARYCNYPSLNNFAFGKQPENILAGVVKRSYTGHATDEAIRRNGASGGVITQTLIHLLETKRITGAICIKMGVDVPWKAKPIIARTKEEILECAQSIYSVTPVNTILAELDDADETLAYVGLPDQVAGIRKLQQLGHNGAQKIKYILGPYQGTQMYFEAIRSFLRSYGIQSEQEITELQYRAGEWPGYLQIKLQDGRTLKAEKFYYNYLIPFFVTQSSLQLVDFTNELTDISVGDAWSPAFEQDRKGHSVVLARTPQAVDLLDEMQQKNIISLENIELTKALDMHGHMIDFKKRGSFIRNSWRQAEPEYGYKPASIPQSRINIERCLGIFFGIGRMPIARWTIEHIPITIVGPCFNWLRKTWKGMSKPTKRKGLRDMKFTLSS